MRRITKEWLRRQPIRITHDPAPFPGKLPTKVAYFVAGWTYVGEPTGSAYRRFMRRVEGRMDSRWMAIEFDRRGPIKINASMVWPPRMNEFLVKFYCPGASVYNTVGDFTGRPWSVRRIGGHRCYMPIGRETRLPTTTIVARKTWLIENGVPFYERARGDKTAL